MERIIRDMLHYLGVEHAHPEDIARIKLRYFSEVRGVRVMLFRAVWPLFFARLLKARAEAEYAEEYLRRY